MEVGTNRMTSPQVLTFQGVLDVKPFELLLHLVTVSRYQNDITGVLKLFFEISQSELQSNNSR